MATSANGARSTTHMQAMRERRRREGFREHLVWLHEMHTEAIEKAIAAGEYKTRSEAVAAAVSQFFIPKEPA